MYMLIKILHCTPIVTINYVSIKNKNTSLDKDRGVLKQEIELEETSWTESQLPLGLQSDHLAQCG